MLPNGTDRTIDTSRVRLTVVERLWRTGGCLSFQTRSDHVAPSKFANTMQLDDKRRSRKNVDTLSECFTESRHPSQSIDYFSMNTRLRSTTLQVSTVDMSAFDSVSFLRTAIQADIVRDTRSAEETSAAGSSAAGHRHGNGRRGRGDLCPPFTFCYADGVAIDPGQEERLSVKDIAVDPALQATGAGAAADRSGSNQRWDQGGGSGEMRVFLRACEPLTEQNASHGGGGGVLHRWESLQGGAWNTEVSKGILVRC